MKTILQAAIQNINWTLNGTFNHVINNQREHEKFYRDKIMDYLNLYTSIKYFKEKELNLITCQKIDLLEISLEHFNHNFIFDDIQSLQLPVGRIIEFGHNGSHQPREWNINKSLSDIKKRTVGQNLSNLYTVHILTDITTLKINCNLTDTYGPVTGNSTKVVNIESDFRTLDPYSIEIIIPITDPNGTVDIYFFICGPFSNDNWSLIVNNFLSYRTSSNSPLDIIYKNKILK